MQFTNKTAETRSEVEENDVSSVEYYRNAFRQSRRLPLLGIEQHHYARKLRLHYLIAQIWMPLQLE